MAQLAEQIREMRTRIQEGNAGRLHLEAKDSEEVISVDHTTIQLSNLYERVRYSVDYKEEHLLRRNAIKRMLKRRLVEQFRKGSVARYLITELVRAGYLPNNQLPTRIADDVSRVVAKVVALNSALAQSDVAVAGPGVKRQGRILAMGAIEIEGILFSQVTAHATVGAFYATVAPLITVKDVEIDDETKNLQTYIACNRALMGYDEDSIFYRLWLLHVTQWETDLSEEEVRDIAGRYDDIEVEIIDAIQHPLNWRMMPKIRDYAIFFAVVKDSIDAKPALWLSEQINLQDVRTHLSQRLRRKYNREQKIVTKAVYRAMIYILLTKVILAIIVEVPFDLFIEGHVNRIALVINLFFPPLLLFVATRVVRLPKADSREHTIESIVSILQGEERTPINVTVERRRSAFGAVLTVLYLFFFGLIFGAIFKFLIAFDFNIVSGGLFLFFLTLVSYFALRIRTRAKRWRVTPKVTSALSFLVDILTLPVVQVGRWLTKKIDKVNVFVFVMDFVIETPFKLIVEVLEGFKLYLKEKKESLE